ncbi:hypothetical protein WICPIJ_001161 [Wickerhamomyces pijperi]|uniref:Letm1 RBD domain-containing protein n=1 Tax=Wickerhamomyces pijperi TaxID=599730 RepID=A0A9P8QC70_WICPI|nr:hypothetical protein WICPIJ_001161 [Wickerhamomyces pijperi]
MAEIIRISQIKDAYSIISKTKISYFYENSDHMVSSLTWLVAPDRANQILFLNWIITKQNHFSTMLTHILKKQSSGLVTVRRQAVGLQRLQINRYQSTQPSTNDKELKKPSTTTTVPVTTPSTEVKPPLWDRIKHEAQHYWDGTKLLGYEVKVSTKLLFKMLRGYELTRREHSQLTRTTGDMFRLVPFSAFVIIPFAELLLPIALKVWPGLLPSTYESTADKAKKREKLLQTRKQTSEFLRKTLKESGHTLRLDSGSTTSEQRAEFVSFFRSLNTIGEEAPTPEKIVSIARMFNNDSVLDNLSRPQLVAMAKYMNLAPFGTDQMLRYQIRYRMLQIIKDDKAIDYEGIESLSLSELQSACISRGIKTSEVSPARLKDDLKIWLDLRLRRKIPSTLLILSSVYTYGEAKNLDSYFDAIVQVFRSIPDEVYNVTKAEVDHSDAKLKLDVIKEQEELIKGEQEVGVKIPVKDTIKLADYEEPKTAEPDVVPEQAAETKNTAENLILEQHGHNLEKEDPKEEGSSKSKSGPMALSVACVLIDEDVVICNNTDKVGISMDEYGPLMNDSSNTMLVNPTMAIFFSVKLLMFCNEVPKRAEVLADDGSKQSGNRWDVPLEFPNGRRQQWDDQLLESVWQWLRSWGDLQKIQVERLDIVLLEKLEVGLVAVFDRENLLNCDGGIGVFHILVRIQMGNQDRERLQKLVLGQLVSERVDILDGVNFQDWMRVGVQKLVDNIIREETNNV